MNNHNEIVKSQPRDRYTTRSMLITFGIVVGLIALIALIGIIFLRPKPEPIVGHVEIEEIRISGKLPARVLAFYVEEGSKVRAGDSLVRLSIPELEGRLTQVEAGKEVADALLDKANAGVRSELKQTAYQAWQGSKAALEASRSTYDRMSRLHEQGVIPDQRYELIVANLKVMEATERAAHNNYQMALRGLSEDDKASAEALVKRADGALDIVNSLQKESLLKAPVDGTVSDIFPHIGELVSLGAPILNLYDTSQKRVIFTLREDLLQGLAVGNTIRGRVPALGDREIDLEITKVKDRGTYAAWKASKPSEEIDLRNFEVTAKPLGGAAEGLIPGMSVVMIRPNSK